ncbi:MAG: hypothetical protein A2V70_08320 [Planctomycetes bacterium RBG_13_63_9]|nr:MAG: hypothetical protein A2V70_08320 [Planctomycetes bacterium RBG_13_63_9]
MRVSCFVRPDGSVGVRNHVAVIPTVLCANEIARRMVGQTPGAVVLPHVGGCTCTADVRRLERVLSALGAHPNVAGVLLVALGCETCECQAVAEEIARRAPWKPLEQIMIQQTGVSSSICQGSTIVEQMVRKAAAWERSETDAGALTLAMECGGSDATSGLAANPALGLAADRIVGWGGSALFSETTEAIGTEHILAQRAAGREVAQRIVDTIARARREMTARLAPGEHFLTSGNMDGGLTTLEEKSLGCICKTGSTPIVEVVEYGQQPACRGLVFVDGTGFDVPSMTGMVAAGAQIVAFTTGKGSPVGYPIAPVIKVSANPNTCKSMKEIVDVDASGVIRGEQDVKEVAEQILREVVAVAGGKRTKAEVFGFCDFAVSTIAGSSASV